MKRILTVQDISCVGKCSLTVALPVISAFGVEAAVLPTAVLSTHTAFEHFTFRDLTEDIKPITEAWKAENLTFDAIYTGYLGSLKQIELVEELFEEFGKNGVTKIADPAMADNGKLYYGFDEAFALRMAKLCGKADVILPNLTEVSFMLGIPYPGEDYDEEYIKSVLKKLTALGAKTAIITGVSLRKEELGAYGYDSLNDKYFYCPGERLPVSYHGTGDLFASAVCGALARGLSVEESTKLAVNFTVESIKKTMENPDRRWYGVDFESAFPYLLKLLSE